ncbi:MAG: undecaprenyl-diphosphate phosphatase [Acidobacteriota bacterium]
MLDNTLWQSIVLGVLQGLTEFLPISSSAHLILVPWLLGWPAMGLTFDVALHAGTLLAVVVYFRQDLLDLSRGLWNWFNVKMGRRTSSEATEASGTVALAILIGTLPAAAIAALAGDEIEYYMRSPLVTVFTLTCFGLILWLADRRGRHLRSISNLTLIDGLVVGAAQMLALVPGVSRSGITITAALFLGLRRADSARFSFLLGTPVIVLAACKGAYDVWRHAGDTGFSATPFVLGIIVSFLSGFLCVKYFLRFLQSRTYLPFVVYRWLLACCILALLLWQ